MFQFQIRRPDDMHAHYRQDNMMRIVLPHAADQFARGIAMPNTIPPVKTVSEAEQYFAHLTGCLHPGQTFEPLMVLYLTTDITMEELEKAKAHPHIHGVKLYPEGVTTNSKSGIDSLDKLFPLVEMIEKIDLPLLIHGETPDPEMDLRDREESWLDNELSAIMKRFPNLRIVCEHISTKAMANFMLQAPENIVCTITPHHMLLTYADKIESAHNFCYPVVKHELDRLALIQLATSGFDRCFAGTDTAPHLVSKKESDTPPGGIYSGYHAVNLYADIFDKALDLTKEKSQKIFEKFMSENGATFYGLPLNSETITLSQKSFQVPERFNVGNDSLVPLMAGKTLNWTVE
jgi:dihydroorotase